MHVIERRACVNQSGAGVQRRMQEPLSRAKQRCIMCSRPVNNKVVRFVMPASIMPVEFSSDVKMRLCCSGCYKNVIRITGSQKTDKHIEYIGSVLNLNNEG